jgi:cardiolipin synthase (CMP-forming)
MMPILTKVKPGNRSLSMNLPNSLTILRILLIPVYVGFLVYEDYGPALLVLLLAGITDAIDGPIARRMNQRTEIGRILDPLADKLLLTSGFVSLAIFHLVPSWVVIIVVSRDVMLLLGTAVAHVTETRINITPTVLGKGTTLLQITYLLLVLFTTWRGSDAMALTPLLAGMVGFTILSGLHYLHRGYRHVNTGGPPGT